MRRLRPRWMLLRRISWWTRQRRWAASWLPSRQPCGAGGAQEAASCPDVSPGEGAIPQYPVVLHSGSATQPGALSLMVARLS